MNSVPFIHPARVYFCYARPAGFSGQKEATEMVMRGLRDRGWSCRALPQPVLDRDVGGRGALLRFAGGLMVSWISALRLLAAVDASLCVNLGQTGISFVRDAVPLLLGRLSLGRRRIVLSLHGSLFMDWQPGEWRTTVFVFLLRQGGLVTVLGEKQRRKLVALGVPPERCVVVVNSCAFPPLTAAAMETKWMRRAGPLRLLHLSSLIASKGFPEYLEALAELAARPGRPVEAVLCGTVTASEFQDRFPDAVAATAWIEETVARINRSERVRVRWVRGAVGEEKAALFREADLFVLPTRYRVEAQPIVLLEAMAAGCAIITTRAGEIATILDDESAVFLSAGSATELAAAFEQAAEEPDAFRRLAEAGHRRFRENYTLEHHLDGWAWRLAPSQAAAPLPPELAQPKP